MKPSRKMEKPLMGQGIQRNDARAYLKVRRMLKEKKVAISALGVEELPVPPVIRGPELRPVTYRAEQVISKASFEYSRIDSATLDTKAYDALKEELTRAMLFDGVFQTRKEVNHFQIRYLGEVTVLMQEK